MASNIISETIDAEYPVAGVDNDTQGFRDNFQIIKDGLTTAKSEITSLQDRSAKLVDDNDNPTENNFRESTITNASLDNVTWKLKPNDGNIEINQTVNVDVGRGHYQVYSIGLTSESDYELINFSLEGWPVRNTNDGVAKVTLHIINNSLVPVVVKFIAANNGAIFKTDAWPTPEGLPEVNYTDDSVLINIAANDDPENNPSRPTIVEFWTYDSGTEVYANSLGVYRKSSDV
jgi:hypothetical protein